MASKRLSMRKIHRVLRLFFEAGLSIRAIARSIQASPSTVGDYIRRAHTAGLSWPLHEAPECPLPDDHDNLRGPSYFL